jgi:hypothetical protein
MAYTYDLLVPTSSPRAFENDSKLGQWTFGVEVTDPFLAQQCGLGNLDPQHSPNDTSDLSAIEAAVTCDIPPFLANLVTIRADSDAIGAMAVLALRQKGCDLDSGALARIKMIGKWDRFDQGRWQEWHASHRPLPPIARAVDLGGAPMFTQALGFIARAHSVSMSGKVALFEAWILHASMPSFAIQGASQDEHAQLSAWNQGRITIERGDHEHIAIVRADNPFGLRIGYRYAPIVIAEGILPAGRKLTVAQFDKSWIDLTAVVARLNALEFGWGGSATIIGSPQGAASKLALKVVRDLVVDELGNGVK